MMKNEKKKITLGNLVLRENVNEGKKSKTRRKYIKKDQKKIYIAKQNWEGKKPAKQ